MLEIATQVAWSYLGRFYRWGGDDPGGFDCSGFVIEILKSVGKLPRTGDWTAQGLYDHFADQKCLNSQEGCLVFWQGRTKIVHVEYCLTESLSIGASGGGSKTKTEADAIAQNAFIKIRPFASRPQVRGLVDPFSSLR